ncbi:MBL fold metallo-hydrolase [Streptomyces sp. NBC_00385]|uniref:MBL fold metallo-hydrolase n=1 Tax=Streptomyces sp. NBC_00385 TaxID=2975733 RepID=UPI002DD8A0AC|nr:MBL fold metallo-hydrolase [Streptomyces sp. NBC_00385]WRZ04112.1 MBL fold metallo-hydrolase [Streptomyces sp. NBC_00385]
MTSGVDEARTEEIADGVFAYIQPEGGWCVSNSGVVRGSTRSVVVDTAATVQRSERLRAEVERIAGTRRATVVNTHMHGDHTFGNCVFAPESTFVSHENARRDMARADLGLTRLWPDVKWGDVRVTLPQITFSDRLKLHTGDTVVELTHLGPAHTTGDIVAWLPEQKVLFCGDIVMNGATPFCLMGSVEGSLRAIRRLKELGPATVVPGHGPVCGPEVLDDCARYLLWVQRLAEDALSQGVGPLEAARSTGLGEWAGLLDSERIVPNLARAFAEARGGALGEPLDEMAAFAQMLEFHGGLPACHA